MSKAKGIVLESNNGYSTVLMEGGQFIKIRRTLEAGQVYQQEGQYRKLAIAVAAVLVLVLLGTVDFFNVVAYANVSNGIEMGINRWNRVIKIERTKETENSSTEYYALKGQKLDKAVSIIVKDVLAEDKNEQDLVIQVNSEKNTDPKLEEKLIEEIETSVEGDFFIPDKQKAEEEVKNSIKITKPGQINKINNGNSNNQSKPDDNKNDQGKTEDRQNKRNNIETDSQKNLNNPKE